MQESMSLEYEPAGVGARGTRGALQRLRVAVCLTEEINLLGQWLQCQANGSNVCRVLRVWGYVPCRHHRRDLTWSRPLEVLLGVKTESQSELGV